MKYSCHRFTKLFLVAICVMMVVLPWSSHATNDEVLVLSLIAECEQCVAFPSFSFLEFTACTDIANLTNYTIHQQQPAGGQTTYRFNSPSGQQQLTNIPAFSRIYFLSYLSILQFSSFMNIIFPTNTFFYDPSYQYNLYGDAGALGLEKDGVAVDTYIFNEVYSVKNGWSSRKSFRQPRPTFYSNEWNTHKGAFASAPPLNSAATPPMKLATYECPRTLRPTKVPTLRPTNSRRAPSTDTSNDKDHNRPPANAVVGNKSKTPTLLPTHRPTAPPTLKPTNPARLP